MTRTPMTNTKTKRTPCLQSFNTFNFRFFHACFVMRGVLGVQLMLVLAGGLGVSVCEDISAWEGIYFNDGSDASVVQHVEVSYPGQVGE